MNWDIIAGRWKQLTGNVQEEWGELTDNEVAEVEGRRDALVGKIQAKYGISKEEAERQVNEWADNLNM